MFLYKMCFVVKQKNNGTLIKTWKVEIYFFSNKPKPLALTPAADEEDFWYMYWLSEEDKSYWADGSCKAKSWNRD